MIGIVYKVTNDVNDLIYIGQTVYLLENRWEWHINKSNNLNDNCKFHKAIREIGANHFKCEEIEKIDKELLNDREIYWIAYYNSFLKGYNSTIGGGGKRATFYLNQAAMNDIISMYNNHYSSNKIAEKYKVDKATIIKFLKGCNIKIREPFRFNPSIEDEQYIIESYKNGKSLSKLAREYKTSNSTIKAFLISRKVELSNRNFILRDSRRCQIIAEEYSTHNVNMQDLMHKYNICFSTMKKILKMFNIPIKNTNGKLKTV